MKIYLATLALSSVLLAGDAHSMSVAPITEAQAFRATCDTFKDLSPSTDPLVNDFLKQFCVSKPPEDQRAPIVSFSQPSRVQEIEEICRNHKVLVMLEKFTPCGRDRITSEHLKNSAKPTKEEKEALDTLSSFQNAIWHFNVSQTRQLLNSLGKPQEQIEFTITAIEVLHEMLQRSIKKLRSDSLTWGEFNAHRLYTRVLADAFINGFVEPLTPKAMSPQKPQ